MTSAPAVPASRAEVGGRHRRGQVLPAVGALPRVEPPERLRRQRPAVAGVREELRQHGEQHRLAADVRLDPAERRGDPVRAEPRERVRDLEIGVGAGEQPPQHLEDRRLAEDQAGVALLGREQSARLPVVQRRGRLPDEAQPARRALLRDTAQQDGRQVRIVQPVVAAHAGQLPDDGVGRDARRQLAAAAEQHLEPGLHADLPGLDDQVPQLRIAVEQGLVRDDLQLSGRAAAAGEPALPGQPARQHVAQLMAGQGHSHRVPHLPPGSQVDSHSCPARSRQNGKISTSGPGPLLPSMPANGRIMNAGPAAKSNRVSQ